MRRPYLDDRVVARNAEEQRLVALAWGYWTNQAAHPTADRAPVAKRLKLLIEHAELDTKDNRDW